MSANTKKQVGILGVGVYLPDEVRTNDWWSAEVVAGWQEKKADRAQKTAEKLPSMANWYDSADADGASSGVGRVLAALMAMKDDPFQGARERRVAPPELLASEMEIRAARDAVARAGVAPADIDLVLSYSSCPDYLTAQNACLVHRALALPEKAFSLAVEAACNSFLMQLSIAQKMIICGQARHALLVQSSNFTRLISAQHSPSAVFGDGATAVVVGPVGDGAGLLGESHHADGTNHDAVVTGVPGKRWNDEGRAMFYAANLESARAMITAVADHGRQVVLEALDDAGHTVDDVDFYAPHQGTAWLRAVTQDFIGMKRARFCDTFPWAGSLSAANIPLALATAQREGTLKAGDLVAMFAGGAGETWSSIVMRWGSG
jgi:3-oxoacyl-[acyl-carrier-protein] synthase-3